MPSPAPVAPASTAAADARKRAAKRDAALRSRLEKEHAKRGTGAAPSVTGVLRAGGAPVILRGSQLVTEAARVMAARRADAVAVVDENVRTRAAPRPPAD